jgi:EmrB/QacA subfamily drug resistance transporter
MGPSFIVPWDTVHRLVTTAGSSHTQPITRHAWFVLCTVSVGQMMTTFSGSALNVAFPSMQAGLETSRATLAWTVTGYAIASASLLLVAGGMADRIGGRRIFLIGLSLFALGATCSGLAPSVGLLIAARVIQGFGSALMIPSSITLALLEFPTQRRSIAIAVWGGFAALAGAGGPPIGGALTEYLGWRWIFLGTIPICLSVLVLGLAILPRTPPRSGREPLDLPGAFLAALGAALVVTVMLQGSRWGWTDGLILAGGLLAVLSWSSLVFWSRRHRMPVLDLDVLRNRRFTVASLTFLVFNMATAGYWLAAPLFLQGVWGWSVLGAGLGIIPGPITHALTARPAGRLADRGHHRSLMIAGTLAAAIGMIGISLRLGPTGNYWTDLFPFSIIIGLSGSLGWATFTSSALVDIQPDRYGRANGLSLTLRQFGAAFGIALVIALLGTGATATADDFRRAWIASAICVLLCTAAVVALYPS